MNPRSTHARWAVPLLFAALGTAACDTFRPEPMPPHHPEAPHSKLRFTVQTEGPEFCREGLWTLSVSVEGGTPGRVELLTNGGAPTTMEAPYQHVVDCATHAEGRFAFVVRTVVGNRSINAGEASVTVDRTPPTVIATRPRGSYPSVSSPMAFVFSEPLLPSSIQSEPTELINRNGIPVPVAHQAVLKENGTVLELVPTSPLQPPVEMSATLLRRSLTDLAGNPLDPSLPDFAFRHFATYGLFASVTELLLVDDVLPIPTDFLLERGAAGTMPVVGFLQFDYRTNTQVPALARWDGNAWQRVPSFHTVIEGASNLVAFQFSARDGEIVAEWREREAVTGLEQIHVASFSGTGWDHFPVPIDTPSKYDWVKLTLAPQGRPVITVGQSTNPDETEVRVLRWTGTEWQSLGAPFSENPAPRTLARRVTIAADDTRVVASWDEAAIDLGPPAGYIHVKAFENGSWGPVGAPIPFMAHSFVDNIALAIQQDHRVLMAWTEHGTYIDPWNGTIVHTAAIRFSSASLADSQPTWAASEFIGPSYEPNYSPLHLVVGRDLEPWLAWSERGTYAYAGRSYVRRLRATGWEPEQFIGFGLFGFQLDEDGNPWALLGNTVMRPQ
ncbi:MULTISPECIES: Ig-like domain-containing protein [Myxococcus]|uniref:Ig-like domain-containing protein n=1 Tax=Myxococcus TaxID=32 RepID=UPI001142A3CE|nr:MULTISPECIES: Ig-like domain-containing protein [Myxococcus]NOK06350.1 Ig-like domain-containing protein [Myxococcus xanthus]